MSRPTPEEKRQAALERMGRYGRVVGKDIQAPRRRSTSQAVRTLSAVRVQEDLAVSVANYANTNHLTYSEGIRTLLEMGLEKADEQDVKD